MTTDRPKKPDDVVIEGGVVKDESGFALQWEKTSTLDIESRYPTDDEALEQLAPPLDHSAEKRVKLIIACALATAILITIAIATYPWFKP